MSFPGCRRAGCRRRLAIPILSGWLLAAVLFPATLQAQEKTVALFFTKELLYNIARDNEGDATKEIVERLKGLSPSITEVDILREGGDVVLAYLVQIDEDLEVKFNLTLEKMAFYRMAAAREDVDGMLKILRQAKTKEPLIQAIAYRFDENYAIIDLTVDLGPAIRKREEYEMMKAAAALTPPPLKQKEEPPPVEPPPVKKEAPPPPVAAPPPPAKAVEKKPPRKAPDKKKAASEKEAPPPPKKAPVYLSARALGDRPPPELDGRPSEAAWEDAEAYTFDVEGTSGTVRVAMSALWGEDRIYFLLRWKDREASVEHHPWEWSEANGEYVVGKAVEDAVALQFPTKGRMGDCMLSGREAQADLWFWKAARTNPVGYAEDGTLTASTSRIPKANFYKAENKATVWIKEKRDAGTSPYRSQVAGTFEGDTVRRYLPRTPSGSSADIRAKGLWAKGLWTVEFSRKLDTGDPADVAFKPKGEHYFSVAVFNRRERSEHSTSRELKLRLE